MFYDDSKKKFQHSIFRDIVIIEMHAYMQLIKRENFAQRRNRAKKKRRRGREDEMWDNL